MGEGLGNDCRALGGLQHPELEHAQGIRCGQLQPVVQEAALVDPHHLLVLPREGEGKKFQT